MKIAVLSPGKVPPLHYGGTERVVLWLVRELVAMGHRVTFLGPFGSVLPEADEVIHFDCPPDINSQPVDLRGMLDPDLDILNLHCASGMQYPLPVLKTVHGYPFHVTGMGFAERGQFDEWYSFVSDAHRNTCARPENPFVHNGLDPSEYLFRRDKEDYFLFLGKVDWNVKGLAHARKVARASKVRLKIAGNFLDPSSYRSLKESLSPDEEYVGPVGGREKAELLAGARALLFTSLWPEPFGLVAIEAMVSGTPVLGTMSGALPEVILHGKTGFLARHVDESVAQAGMLERISPDACRTHVLDRFSSRRMAEDYLRLYVRTIRTFHQGRQRISPKAKRGA
jgi:glycosyltransferase involved in cell wall biosynthesis